MIGLDADKSAHLASSPITSNHELGLDFVSIACTSVLQQRRQGIIFLFQRKERNALLDLGCTLLL